MSLSWVVSIRQAHREGWRRQAAEGRESELLHDESLDLSGPISFSEK